MTKLRESYAACKDVEPYELEGIPSGHCLLWKKEKDVGNLVQKGYLLAVKDEVPDTVSTSIVLCVRGDDEQKYWREAEHRLLDNYKNL